jgi:hypothetical protein
MPYVDPKDVTSPRERLRDLDVIHDGGVGSWSAAWFTWDGEKRLGLRWNGRADEPGPGNPTSRGYPTWFVVPNDLAEALEAEIKATK